MDSEAASRGLGETGAGQRQGRRRQRWRRRWRGRRNRRRGRRRWAGGLAGEAGRAARVDEEGRGRRGGWQRRWRGRRGRRRGRGRREGERRGRAAGAGGGSVVGGKGRDPHTHTLGPWAWCRHERDDAGTGPGVGETRSLEPGFSACVGGGAARSDARAASAASGAVRVPGGSGAGR